jgi:hypothetical protein
VIGPFQLCVEMFRPGAEFRPYVDTARSCAAIICFFFVPPCTLRQVCDVYARASRRAISVGSFVSSSAIRVETSSSSAPPDIPAACAALISRPVVGSGSPANVLAGVGHISGYIAYRLPRKPEARAVLRRDRAGVFRLGAEVTVIRSGLSVAFGQRIVSLDVNPRARSQGRRPFGRRRQLQRPRLCFEHQMNSAILSRHFPFRVLCR